MFLLGDIVQGRVLLAEGPIPQSYVLPKPSI